MSQSTNAQDLLDSVCITIDNHVRTNATSVFDILAALEALRHDITEEFIKNHPELIWCLHQGQKEQ